MIEDACDRAEEVFLSADICVRDSAHAHGDIYPSRGEYSGLWLVQSDPMI